MPLLRSSGQIPRRLRRFKDRASAKILRLSEAKVERRREGLPRGILFKSKFMLLLSIFDNLLKLMVLFGSYKGTLFVGDNRKALSRFFRICYYDPNSGYHEHSPVNIR
jgi:hypothetical protein